MSRLSSQETTTVTSMVPPPDKLPAGRQAIKKSSSFKTSLASPTLYHPEQVGTFAIVTVSCTCAQLILPPAARATVTASPHGCTR